MRGASPRLLMDSGIATTLAAYDIKQGIKTTKAYAKVLGVTLQSARHDTKGFCTEQFCRVLK